MYNKLKTFQNYKIISLKGEARCCEPNEYFIKVCDRIAFDSREL